MARCGPYCSYGRWKILADLHPDELLSTRLLEENGIREPLYLTALRYAGVELAPAKKPAHVDSVVIDKADRKKMTDWFWSRPAAEAEKEHEPLLEVRNLTFGYERGRQTLRDVSLTIQKGEMVSIVGKTVPGNLLFPNWSAALRHQIPVKSFSREGIFCRKISATEPNISAM